MSDELKELKRRLLLDMEEDQKYPDSDSGSAADGLKAAIFELENLDKPYFGGRLDD
ncbi:MAG: hypothetical protein ABF624_02085 [Liquorilactobacillus ghanensis]|uniref:hypothetical protein n=1 Tax=Liquorilactobacillus ghanensis TaxID=399370 RepID=UPI0039E9F433